MVHQELFKIPPNVILVVGLIVELVRGLEFGPNCRAPALQKFINWVLIFPVHIRLGKHFKVRHEIVARPDVAKHRVDLAGIRAGLLSQELIARKAQNLKGPVRVPLGGCIHSVVLRGVASKGGQVDDEEHLVGVLGVRKGDIVHLLNVFSCKVVQTSWVIASRFTACELLFIELVAKDESLLLSSCCCCCRIFTSRKNMFHPVQLLRRGRR